MRECQQCGEANDASSRFCVVCGAPLSGAPAAAPARAANPAAAAAAAAPDPAAAPAPAALAPRANDLAEDLGSDFPLDGPRTLVGFLVSFESVETGQYWPIHQGRNVVGRQGAATGLDIEIAHATTSSLHAVLLAASKAGRVVLEDTQSTNGTFVNDDPLLPGQRRELRDGDRVRFGLFNTIIKVIQAPA
jgi:hypothetical protein